MLRYKVYGNRKRLLSLLSFNRHQRDIERIINEHAEDGWKLRSVVANFVGIIFFLVFERED